MISWRQVLFILWVIQFFVTMAMTLGMTFVPFYLEKDPYLAVTSNADRIYYTSLILAGPFLSTLIATPFWGWMGDRMGRKKQILRATLGLGIAQLLMGFAITPMQLVLIRVFQGLVSGVIAANLGMLSAITPTDNQGRAISILLSSSTVGMVLGPMVGGGLAQVLGFRQVYWSIGGVILFAAFLSWLWLPNDQKPAHEAEEKPSSFTLRDAAEPFRDLYQSIRKGWSILPLRLAFSLLFFGNLAWSLLQAVLAIYAGKLILLAIQARAIQAAWWNEDLVFASICMSMIGLSSFVLSFFWGRSHDAGKKQLMPMASVLIAVGALLLVAWPPWWVVLLACLVMGGGLSGISSLPYAMLSAKVSVDERSQYMGLGTSTINLGKFVGFLLGGVIARAGGESANFLLTAFFCVLLIALSWQRPQTA